MGVLKMIDFNFNDPCAEYVRGMYVKYNDDSFVPKDSELVADYREIVRARMTKLAEDAKRYAEELEPMLEALILYRMGGLARQADKIAQKVYDAVLNIE